MRPASRHHWVERCPLQDEHWDQTPWPAQIARHSDWEGSLMSSDDDDDDDDDDMESPRMSQQRRRRSSATGRREAPARWAAFDSNPVKGAESLRPPFCSESLSWHHRRKSDCHPDEALRRGYSRRQHARKASAPQPATGGPLHIDTILPLKLPPTNLCTMSPLMAYPCSWWSTGSIGSSKQRVDVLHRSESSHSFLSAPSDGSWHGDSGDENPDRQLDEAISRMKTTTMALDSKCIKDPLTTVCTYDYDEDADQLVLPHDDDGGDEMGEEGSAIRSHAGPLMNNVAWLFLDHDSIALPGSLWQPTLSRPRSIAVSHSDGALMGPILSTSQLNSENCKLLQSSRQRSSTMPFSAGGEENGRPSAAETYQKSILSSLWQWIMPQIDEQLENDLFGYPRTSPRPRNDSLPSLSSGCTTEDESESEWEDEGGNDSFRRGQLWFSSASLSALADEQRGAPPKQSHRVYNKAVPSPDATPSPLWDNRWVEEPYQRSWSSVLGLSSM